MNFFLQWNGHGYEIAKIFAHKFTHICPVWLQIKLNDDEETTRLEGTICNNIRTVSLGVGVSLCLVGLQDIDYKWIKALREANPNIKIVPRVIFDGWPQNHLVVLLREPKLPATIGRQLAETAKVAETGFCRCLFHSNDNMHFAEVRI